MLTAPLKSSSESVAIACRPPSANAIGAVAFTKDSEDINAPGPIKTTQIGAGLRVAARGVHVTIGVNWSPDGLPAATAGMGLLF